MERCELSRLNALCFERLVRALAFQFFGPSGRVYSAGPDGGRDFVIEGKIPHYEGRAWNGRLVLQAKFREKLTNDARDITWLENQLTREESKFRTKAKRVEKFDYYIIATNVALSGADSSVSGGRSRKGGYTKIASCLTSWKKSIKIKDSDIWSADKILDLLANAPSIRRTYLAWVTPGDVLAAALEKIGTKQKFDEQIRRSIKNALYKDQFARLKDAGSVTEETIRTSQVFVDLPLVDDDPHSKLGKRRRGESDSKPQVVCSLVERSRAKLDPESLSSEESENSGSRRQTE